jgi:hypothetical protein
MQNIMRVMSVVTLLLVVIVAYGNWQLFDRMERVETTIGLRAK